MKLVIDVNVVLSLEDIEHIDHPVLLSAFLRL
jgi:hypothetical protein